MERKVICKNVGVCSKANKVQIITDDDAELICPECGEPVELVKDEPQPEALKGNKAKMMACIAGAILLIAIIVGCLIAFSGGGDEKSQFSTADSTAADSTETAKPDTVTVVKTDTVKQVDTVTVEKVVEKQVSVAAKAKTSAPKATAAPKTSTASSNGTLRLSYGKYSGAIKNGYPHGQGRLTYTRSRQINRNDAKGRTANAGDYVIGEFYNGFLVYGKHYDSAGNLLGSLNFGVGNESSYDSK